MAIYCGCGRTWPSTTSTIWVLLVNMRVRNNSVTRVSEGGSRRPEDTSMVSGKREMLLRVLLAVMTGHDQTHLMEVMFLMVPEKKRAAPL